MRFFNLLLQYICSLLISKILTDFIIHNLETFIPTRRAKFSVIAEIIWTSPLLLRSQEIGSPVSLQPVNFFLHILILMTNSSYF